MRRLARHLFMLGSAVSLVLCVATVAMWIRGRWVVDVAWRDQPESDAVATVACGNGYLRFVTLRPWASAGPWHLESAPKRAPLPYAEVGVGWPFPHARAFAFPGVFAATGVGCLYIEGPRDTVRQTRYAQATAGHVSLWFLAAVTAAPPVLVVARRVRGQVRRRRRWSRGLCLACGYDLRASPERCPECGAENAG